jgi:hypothetical protein
MKYIPSIQISITHMIEHDMMFDKGAMKAKGFEEKST